MDCHFYTSANGERTYSRVRLIGFPSLSPLTDWYFYTSANGEWACSCVRLIGFPSLSPLTDCYFYTSANGERAYSRVRLIDFLSLSPLIDCHFYTSANGDGHMLCMTYGFFSLSPLMDCYFYTSTNGERTYSRVRLMIFLHCLYWWITTSTLLQMENGHVTVYALWLLFIVSINGLLLIHFCRPII